MRVNSAVVVSVGVDALDYLAPMLSAMQIVGDISDKGSKKKEWFTIKKKDKAKRYHKYRPYHQAAPLLLARMHIKRR
jgi:hypothetical protein